MAEYHSLNEDLFREKIKVSDLDISMSHFLDHVEIKTEYNIHVKCLEKKTGDYPVVVGPMSMNKITQKKYAE